MSMLDRNTAMGRMLLAGIVLGVFAIGGAALVVGTHEATKARIAANEKAAMLDSLHQLIPARRYDNDVFRDKIMVTDSALLGTTRPVAVYRVTKDGKPVAAALTPVAQDGYNGAIHLLVAIYHDGTLAGVRVISENETPGLGDKIEIDKTSWALRFTGKSLTNPPLEKWAVRRDGGEFDQFTGATISPRAVVKAVKDCLIYFKQHRDELFSKPGEPAEAPANG